MDQKKDTEKTFSSPSTGNPCDVSQYIAEILCTRKAEKDGVPSLEYRFWSNSKKKEYQGQLVAARRLINKYGRDAVLNFINSNRRIYSLGKFNSPKFITAGIEKEMIKLRNKVTITPVPTENNTVDLKRRSFKSKKNMLSQIKGIEKHGDKKETD